MGRRQSERGGVVGESKCGEVDGRVGARASHGNTTQRGDDGVM